jgi:hypothetical protein
MRGAARLCPTRRGVLDIENRIQKLRTFSTWREPIRVNFEQVVGSALWSQHWTNHQRLVDLMQECQATAAEIRLVVQRSYWSDASE